MIINLNYEDALRKASPPLRRKMEHTRDVILKALPLALKYDPDAGFYVGMSFGKDSQALYHMMQLCEVPFFAYFSPTSIDPPEVIRFGRTHYPEVKFNKITESIFTVFKRMKVLPSMKIRFCCAHFKERGGEGKVVCTGVRKAESVRRSKRNEIEVSGRKFSGHMDEFDEWQEKRIRRKIKNLNQDQFSEVKETEVRCISGKDKILLNPIIEWSEHDVWEFLNKVVEVPHCELYDQGWTRIGCILCPMASGKSTARDLKRWPHVKEKWIKAIMDVRKESILASTPPSDCGLINCSTTDCPPPEQRNTPVSRKAAVIEQTLEGRNRPRFGETVRKRSGDSSLSTDYTPPQFPSWATQYTRMRTARRRFYESIRQIESTLPPRNQSKTQRNVQTARPKSRIGGGERHLKDRSSEYGREIFRRRQWRSLGCCR